MTSIYELFTNFSEKIKKVPLRGFLCIGMYYADCEVVHYKNSSIIFCHKIFYDTDDSELQTGILVFSGKFTPTSKKVAMEKSDQLQTYDAFIILGRKLDKKMFLTFESQKKYNDIFLEDDEENSETIMGIILTNAIIASRLPAKI